MGPIRLGVPRFLSARPLVYGLTRAPHPDIEITFNEPAILADALARGQLDAALIPSIEHLRGAGHHYVDGPALVARPGRGCVVLIAKKPLAAIERVAVGEFCRTAVAALRIALADQHDSEPDLLVEKNPTADWHERYDAVLLSADNALHQSFEPPAAGDTAHDVASMWEAATGQPLVAALWAYNEGSLAARLGKIVHESRNLGVQNLSSLADGIAQSSEFESEFLYEHFLSAWAYELTERDRLGLRTLEKRALSFDLLRDRRPVPVPTG